MKSKRSWRCIARLLCFIAVCAAPRGVLRRLSGGVPFPSSILANVGCVPSEDFRLEELTIEPRWGSLQNISGVANASRLAAWWLPRRDVGVDLLPETGGLPSKPKSRRLVVQFGVEWRRVLLYEVEAVDSGSGSFGKRLSQGLTLASMLSSRARETFGLEGFEGVVNGDFLSSFS